jgi:hypothetical protein
MGLSRRTNRPGLIAAAAVVGVAALVAPLREARADNVSPSGKGIAGGALLGAEAVTIVESLVGVHSGWAYVIGAVVGAGGGAAGGYAVEQGSSNGQVPMYMLAGGLALVIPAVVLTLDATRYRPEEGVTEDRTPQGPAAEPGVPGGSVGGGGSTTVSPSAPTPPPSGGGTPPPPSGAPQSLFDVNHGDFRLGLPLPSVVPMFSPTETKQYGLTRNDAEVKMPVLHVSF